MAATADFGFGPSSKRSCRADRFRARLLGLDRLVFKTWYVIFEFKNHTRYITQGEVYSTEKYLFVPAMRSVAFVISRKGTDKNAKAVMRGALRETGKLILSLSLDEVCTMLKMKDAGDEPNTLLFKRLDEMLMKLER